MMLLSDGGTKIEMFSQLNGFLCPFAGPRDHPHHHASGKALKTLSRSKRLADRAANMAEIRAHIAEIDAEYAAGKDR